MTQQKRILFFVYDGMGGGHLARMSRIADALQSEKISCLIVSGHRETAWMVSKRCEYIHLPNTRVLILKGLHGQSPFMNFESIDEIVSLRKKELKNIVNTFRPDAIFTDFQPIGSREEFREIIETYPATKYFIARGVMDTPEKANNDIILHKGCFLENFYKRIFVTCDRKVCDFSEEYNLKYELAQKVVSVGYVSPKISKKEIVQVRKEAKIIGKDKWVVCSGGTGHLSEEVVDDYLALARKYPNIMFDIILGPRNSWHSSYICFPFQEKRNIRLWRENINLKFMHAACDIVICPGSYNSLVEAFQGGASIIVRNINSRFDNEPLLHEKKLEKLIKIRKAESKKELFNTFEQALLDKPQDYKHINCNGANNIKKVVEKDLL